MRIPGRANTAHSSPHRGSDALLRGCPSPRARSWLPDALLWPLKIAENLSFRNASVATHTHTSSPLAVEDAARRRRLSHKDFK
eukprot:COSAG06_NODE_611_length_13818_cov_9.629346_8_plen_83_part_00